MPPSSSWTCPPAMSLCCGASDHRCLVCASMTHRVSKVGRLPFSFARHAENWTKLLRRVRTCVPQIKCRAELYTVCLPSDVRFHGLKQGIDEQSHSPLCKVKLSDRGLEVVCSVL